MLAGGAILKLLLLFKFSNQKDVLLLRGKALYESAGPSSRPVTGDVDDFVRVLL